MNFLRLFCVALVLGWAGGCAGKPKHPKPATQVEEQFKQRWLAKRIADLAQAGVTDTREARRIALEEFRVRYEYTNASKKIDPVTGAVLP